MIKRIFGISMLILLVLDLVFSGAVLADVNERFDAVSIAKPDACSGVGEWYICSP